MNIKDRLKWLFKIAQTATDTTTTDPTTAGPTTVAGDPTPVDIVTYFASVSQAWGPANLNFIQQIVNILNYSIYVFSSGQLDFNRLRIGQFSVDASKFPDAVLMAVVRLSQMVYNRILTNAGQPFTAPLTPEDKKARINQMVQTINSSNIPAGAINNFLRTKIGGNLKEMLLSVLPLIK